MRLNFTTLQEFLRFLEEEELELYPRGKVLAICEGETRGPTQALTFAVVSALPISVTSPYFGVCLDYCCPIGTYFTSSDGDRRRHLAGEVRPKVQQMKDYCRERGYRIYEGRFLEGNDLVMNRRFTPDEEEADASE